MKVRILTFYEYIKIVPQFYVTGLRRGKKEYRSLLGAILPESFSMSALHLFNGYGRARLWMRQQLNSGKKHR